MESTHSSQTFNSTSSTTALYDPLTTLGAGLADQVQAWSIILDRIQLAIAILGFVGNSLTVWTLVKNGGMFSRGIRLLLKHQALIDSWSCLMAAILLIQPPMWKSGWWAFDAVVCYGWHSQAVYWATVYMSVWNLMDIAVERYVAICYPFYHQTFIRTPVKLLIAGEYVASAIVLFPSYIQFVCSLYTWYQQWRSSSSTVA